MNGEIARGAARVDHNPQHVTLKKAIDICRPQYLGTGAAREGNRYLTTDFKFGYPVL